MKNPEVDFMAGVFDFIVEFTEIDENVVFRGFQSQMVLPDDDEFCIFTPINRSRIGTNKRDFNAIGVPDDENGIEAETQGVAIDVQIDFYGENADRMAQAIDTAAHSLMANKFFRRNGYDVRCLYSTSPQNLTGIDETNQYAIRWSVTATFLIESAISEDLPWFEDITLANIKNVDVYFPPNND